MALKKIHIAFFFKRNKYILYEANCWFKSNNLLKVTYRIDANRMAPFWFPSRGLNVHKCGMFCCVKLLQHYNLENGSVAEKDFAFWNVKFFFLKLPNSSRKPNKKILHFKMLTLQNVKLEMSKYSNVVMRLAFYST